MRPCASIRMHFHVQMHMCMRIVFVLHAETLWVHLAACVLFREC